MIHGETCIPLQPLRHVARLNAMRTLYTLVAVLLSVCVQSAGKAQWPPEPLIEMRVQFAPTAFPAAGATYLVYELRVTNLSKEPVSVKRLELIDAANGSAAPLATYDGAQLDPVLQHFGNPAVGDQMPTAADSHRQLAAGETVILFLTIALDDRARGVQSLKHRLFTSDASIEGAITSTAGVKLLALGPPLRGGPWAAKSGAAKNDSHHRRQFMVLGGSVTLSNRCAIDWVHTENDASFKGPEDDIRSYLSYESPVLAVANGKVVAIRDGIPDNKPGHVGAEALNLTLETIVGNFVVLDLGHGQFAYYAHLQPGSLRVKLGQQVTRGAVVARIGNSGSSFEPHLHFEVTTSPMAMRGEGVPYVIDDFTVVSGGTRSSRHHELPIAGSLIEFRPAQ
jgi:murein DD-endopeptidase MepM/ murein hydrolase activator NlpD